MDQTPLFIACLRAVRTRNKELSAAAESRVLPRRAAGPFQRRAADIVASVARLAAFLQEHRAGYLSTGRADGPALSEAERDQVDAGAQAITRTCSQLVREFRRELVPAAGGDQAAQHRQAVADSMEAYLKTVCGIYAEMKAVRVKRSVDRRNMSQIMTATPRPAPAADRPTPPAVPPEDGGGGGAPSWEQDRPSSPLLPGDELTPEDLQMLQAENDQMLNELNSMTKRCGWSRVLEQDKDVDRIGDTVIGTTENIKDANEQLRSAIKKNAGTRVWVMFFLLVISFSLLFLDWYND
ncbi:syntaxin-18-like [Pollicipes pollicipes]|uniref:syntaxin-18-like n=1 Tax=Pollicipes pollicipes TaxID=41117 RepID=UPI001884938F|nr:syntaxin-18-like [Pollicipes pollicipes]